ncbi:MAG: hypothetical protein IT585_05535 [candidate division Zixibacteria bacterium]|nr:hypothetical protein [candidate division Zixibacteria bacterium]
MRILKALLIVALILAVALIAGCERKIVNEVASNDQSLNGCFACHGETSFDGALQQARGEWENSLHASGTSIDYTNRAKSDCQQCHDHQGFLDWINTGDEDTLALATVSAIHCFTCHAPHERGDLTLRTEAPYTLKNGVVFDHGAANLCVNCHHSRTSLATDLGTADSVTLNSRTGPHHGPQGDMLQGTHGYQFAGYTYTSTTHATVVEDGCIGCHMGNPTQHDGYNIGGHSFNMEYESHDGTTYTLIGVCAPCHSRYSESGVTKFDDFKPRDIDGDGVIEGFQTEFDNLADSLKVLLTKVVDPATNLFRTKKIARLQAAAAYNWAIYKEDRSHGAHNPKYFEGLLKSSIQYLNANPITLP